MGPFVTTLEAAIMITEYSAKDRILIYYPKILNYYYYQIDIYPYIALIPLLEVKERQKGAG